MCRAVRAVAGTRRCPARSGMHALVWVVWWVALCTVGPTCRRTWFGGRFVGRAFLPGCGGDFLLPPGLRRLPPGSALLSAGAIFALFFRGSVVPGRRSSGGAVRRLCSGRGLAAGAGRRGLLGLLVGGVPAGRSRCHRLVLRPGGWRVELFGGAGFRLLFGGAAVHLLAVVRGGLCCSCYSVSWAYREAAEGISRLPVSSWKAWDSFVAHVAS